MRGRGVQFIRSNTKGNFKTLGNRPTSRRRISQKGRGFDSLGAALRETKEHQYKDQHEEEDNHKKGGFNSSRAAPREVQNIIKRNNIEKRTITRKGGLDSLRVTPRKAQEH
jgi:hypothetical protein